MVTSRERLETTLDHRQPDRVCADLGAFLGTGIHASTLSKLRVALLGQSDHRVRVLDLGLMVGEVDEDLCRALPIDVVHALGAFNSFGLRNEGWKPWELPDGTPVLVPGAFNPTIDGNGDLLAYPEGDTSVAPSGRMPRDGLYFDTIVRQDPIVENHLDPADNWEDFALMSDADVAQFANEARRLHTETDYGVLVELFQGVSSYGEVGALPGPGLKHPKGIRDPQEWWVSHLTRPDYVHAVYERQTEIALANIKWLAAAAGDCAQVAAIGATDFGGQRGPLISPQMYRQFYSPCYRQINAAIHELTVWRVFFHSCGSIYDLIPDMIEDGFDILNPVQTSAAKMDPRTLKREFGDRVVLWGGGVDTQTTLPFGTPEEVYREVRERIDIFNDGGGYVFAAVHNIQADVPVPNILAMIQAVRDSRA